MLIPKSVLGLFYGFLLGAVMAVGIIMTVIENNHHHHNAWPVLIVIASVGFLAPVIVITITANEKDKR